MRDELDPFLDAGMRGYIYNTARKNYWRVAELCDFADLVQDGFLVYAKCRRAYLDPRPKLKPNKDNKRWFQAKVQFAFSNHINSLAAKHKGVSERPISGWLSREESYDAMLDCLPAQPEMGTLAALIASAPAEIKQILTLLLTDATGFQRQKVGRRKIRETNNERLCRLLGRDPSRADLYGFFKAYFSGV